MRCARLRRSGRSQDGKQPCIKSWTLVGEAIEALSAVEDEHSAGAGATAPDDLTSIQGIDAGLAQHLASLGVTRFADIAAWRSDDVHNVSQALGISREISRQNWIEQAALLERRKAKSEIEPAAPAESTCPTFGRSCRRLSRRPANTRPRTTMRRPRLRSSWPRRHWANGLMQPLRPASSVRERVAPLQSASAPGCASTSVTPQTPTNRLWR